jgi:hypothetical protein
MALLTKQQRRLSIGVEFSLLFGLKE